MSYQEKKSLTNIISSIVITSIYAVVMYQKYLNGAFDTTNIFRLWAIIILIFIPISVISRIIIMIIFHILESVVQTAKGEEVDLEMDIVDERDKLIEMKVSKISMMVFALGFIIALAIQLFDVSNHSFFIIMVISGLITEVLSETLSIIYYRKGV
ncbi:hypothetical protein KQ51_00510 [Candidatus Izimaplasma bacterium HR1]|uniref:hypothetical protein n=1 Tax=Candidatus Izimoplasma sp. HR1 TaxID=1541959 RepID=UPI0004F67F9B|nr:hypothetical protein KQ51_00510 [Candidatus Izimaplasma bacterium HR1]